MIERPRVWWPAAVIAAGAPLTLLAFVVPRLWREIPWKAFAASLTLAALAMLLAWGLRRLTRWSMASCLAATWGVALAVQVGVPSLAAVALLVIAALALGLRIVPPGPGRIAIAIAAGLMLVAGATGWILMLPVHDPLAWGGVLLAIALSNRRGLVLAWRDAATRWRDAVADAPRWAAFAMLLIGLASTACWLPTMQYDDLTYHLGLPTQLREHAQYAPMPQHQVWAFAPWASDVLHAIAGVLARGEVRGALDACWLALAAATLAATAARLQATSAERWACVALLASFPPIVWLAAGMQTELPALSVLLALAATALSSPHDPHDAPAGRGVFAGAVLFGGLLALKPMHAFAALPLLAYAGWRHRGRWPWRRLPAALAIAVLVGGSSYAYAWWYTGNPVLPLFNATFASPYFPVRDFDDARWHAGFGWSLPWRITVDTDRYGENWDGGFGFALVALGGAWTVALLRRDTRAFAIAASCALLLPLLPLQYARYAVPGAVLWFAAVLPRTEQAVGPRPFTVAIVALCAANLAFQANSGWTYRAAALKDLLRGRETAVLTRYVPERVLAAVLPAGDGGVVLATDPARPFAAVFGGRGRALGWHDPTLSTARGAAEADRSGARWRQLFADNDVRWLLVTPASASPALRAALDASATRVTGAGDAELWRVRDAGGAAR